MIFTVITPVSCLFTTSKTDKDWDFGTGAGFYVDSTTPAYANNYRMYSYVTKELIQLVEQHFDSYIKKGVRAITGHSMGGHGALIR